MQTVSVKRHDGEKIKITVDAEGYVDLKRQIARGELPEQTLAAYKGDDGDDPDAVQNPTATDGQSSDEQKNAEGKTAVPAASKPATTGAGNPFDPDKGKTGTTGEKTVSK